jgi:hypothetical protein
MICCVLISTSSSHATTPVKPIEQMGAYKISMLSQLTLKDWSALVGKPLNPFQKMGITALRHKMKVTLRKKGDMTFNEFIASHKKMKTWLLVLLIVLGTFLLVAIIFGLAYGGVI